MLAALSVVAVLIGGGMFVANNLDAVHTSSAQDQPKVEYVAQSNTPDQPKL
ncbi:MAG: hypothetical protein MUE39_06105 [Gammaproteobacteria bacterium]|jgi:hypothetical protein|nr:hypothetical protein [Gammaproteobacteria bacterium]